MKMKIEKDKKYLVIYFNEELNGVDRFFKGAVDTNLKEIGDMRDMSEVIGKMMMNDPVLKKVIIDAVGWDFHLMKDKKKIDLKNN
jgi:hypothetical protein